MDRDPPSKVRILPAELGRLDGPLPYDVPPETLFALGTYGGMSVEPDADFVLLFGRNYEDVHVCVGGDDQQISRRQGSITYEGSRWILRNIGKCPIRIPRRQLVFSGHSQELPSGYTPLFVIGARREHLLQVRVSGTRSLSAPQPSVYGGKTLRPCVELTDRQHLVVVCLAQRYLNDEPDPQPMPWADVKSELDQLQPEEEWTSKKASWIVKRLRETLAVEENVKGMRAKEVSPPIGNTLNHNLITHLMATARLVPEDLHLLEKEPKPKEQSPSR